MISYLVACPGSKKPKNNNKFWENNSGFKEVEKKETFTPNVLEIASSQQLINSRFH